MGEKEGGGVPFALGRRLLVLGKQGKGLEHGLVAVDVADQQMGLVDNVSVAGAGRGRVRLFGADEVVDYKLNVVSSTVQLVAFLDEETCGASLICSTISRHGRPHAVFGELQ